MLKFSHYLVFDIEILCNGIALFGVCFIESVPNNGNIVMGFRGFLGVAFLFFLSLLQFVFTDLKSLLNLNHLGLVVEFGEIIKLFVFPHR
jgi:hypothetical protein